MRERFVSVDRYIEHLDGWVAELCAVPSVSARHEGIEDCAGLVAGLLGQRGFAARVVATLGPWWSAYPQKGEGSLR